MTTGGTIAGGQSLYYAMSAVDSSGGRERAIVSIVQATIPADDEYELRSQLDGV